MLILDLQKRAPSRKPLAVIYTDIEMTIDKIAFSYFFLLLTNIVFGQVQFSSSQLDTMVIVHQYHCDMEKMEFRQDIELGENPMKIAFIKCYDKSGTLNISGQIIANNKDGIQSEIYLASILGSTCQLQKISNSDKKGFFNFKISTDDSQSIYFKSLGYLDLEIAVNKINYR
ncbi:MAG: hypothetical protein KA163_08730 [Bacteroidia bacterium]|nr:hypothetical protein [Bacteroidia bacterium]